MAKNAQRLLAAGATVAVAEPIMLLAHQGGFGMLIGAGLGLIAYHAAGDVVKDQGREESLPADRARYTQHATSVASRLLVGKSVREGAPRAKREDGQDDDLTSLEDLIQQRDGTLPGPCVFSDALRTFTPTRDKIFLGYLPGGQAVYVTLEDLCHVALAGLTGNGKTTLIRLLVSQLEYVKAKVIILNPHYTSYDIKKDEDWTPIERHLYRPPVTDFSAIGTVMEWVAKILLRERLEKYRQSKPWGDPIFVVIDELPAIVKQVPDFPEYVSAILREGRKVDIFLIVAAQDFLAKTIGPDDGGAVRKNYKTKMYVGGDTTTAKVLLDMPPAQIPEDTLGGGIIMMRNQVVKKASLARVPYVDNEALYTLLGPSTYEPAQSDDLLSYRESAPAPRSEPITDPRIAAQPRKAVSAVPGSVYARRQARQQRLREVPVVEQRERPHGEVEISLQEAYRLWTTGNDNIRDLAKVLNTTTYQASKLYTAMVNAKMIEPKKKVVFRD